MERDPVPRQELGCPVLAIHRLPRIVVGFFVLNFPGSPRNVIMEPSTFWSSSEARRGHGGAAVAIGA